MQLGWTLLSAECGWWYSWDWYGILPDTAASQSLPPKQCDLIWQWRVDTSWRKKSSMLSWKDHRYMARMATLKGVEAFIQKLSNGFEYQIRCYKNLITGNLNLHKIVFLKKWNFLKGNLNFIVWQVICYQKFCRISDATLILADYFFLFHIELWHLVYLIFEKGIQNTMKKMYFKSILY